MMSGPILPYAVAIVLCLTLAGCVGPDRSWTIPSFMTPPATNANGRNSSTVGSSYRSRNERETSRSRTNIKEHAVTEARPVSPAPASEGPASAPVPPTPQPNVTLAEEGASRDEALRFLDGAKATLEKIDRGKLSREGAATYDQANDLLRAGQKAASEHDYVAASGYAQKASVLVNNLTAASP